MSCTYRLYKGVIQKRVFMIFERQLPMELILSYKRIVPKSTGGSGIGFGNHFHWTDVSNIEFTKIRKYRFASQEEAGKQLHALKNKAMCYKCADPSIRCTEKWIDKAAFMK